MPNGLPRDCSLSTVLITVKTGWSCWSSKQYCEANTSIGARPAHFCMIIACTSGTKGTWKLSFLHRGRRSIHLGILVVESHIPDKSDKKLGRGLTNTSDARTFHPSSPLSSSFKVKRRRIMPGPFRAGGLPNPNCTMLHLRKEPRKKARFKRVKSAK